jgi:hypothetical protein
MNKMKQMERKVKLAKKFKIAVAGAGLVISALGVTAMEQSGFVGLPQSAAASDSVQKLNFAEGNAVFFAGTTLVALGARRKKGTAVTSNKKQSSPGLV